MMAASTTTISASATSVSRSSPNSVFLRLPLRFSGRAAPVYEPLFALCEGAVLPDAGLADAGLPEVFLVVRFLSLIVFSLTNKPSS
jgi:hypothetical protein